MKTCAYRMAKTLSLRGVGLTVAWMLIFQESLLLCDPSHLAPPSHLKPSKEGYPSPTSSSEDIKEEAMPVSITNLLRVADIPDPREKREILEKLLTLMKQHWLGGTRRLFRSMDLPGSDDSAFKQMEESIEIIPETLRWEQGRLRADFQHRKARRRYVVEVMPKQGEFPLSGLITRLLDDPWDDFKFHVLKEHTVAELADPIMPVFDVPKTGEPKLVPREYDDLEEMYYEAAKEAVKIIKADQEKGRKTVLGLFTGTTAHLFYRKFVPLFRQAKLNPKMIVTFNLDEYLGMNPKDSHSYRYFMDVNFFKPLRIPQKNIHFPNSLNPSGKLLSASELEHSVAEYEKDIERAGGIDLQLLGIGPNGHIGFNEPGSPFDSVTHVGALLEETRKANARHFGGMIERVPTHAMTMGIASILKARQIFLIASGEEKAGAIVGMMHGKIHPDVPASVLRRHPQMTIFLDNKAAAGLWPIKRVLDKAVRGLWQAAAFGVFAALWLVFWSPYGAALVTIGFGMYFLTVLFSPIAGTALILMGLLLLAEHNRHLRADNPFLGLSLGQSHPPQKGIVYGVGGIQGLECNYAYKSPRASTRPILVVHHGGEYAELFVGMKHKIRHVSEQFSGATYDVRFYWLPADKPYSLCNRLLERKYPLADDSQEDSPVVVSAPHVDIGRWFYQIPSFKDYEERAMAVHDLIREGKLISQEGVPVSTEMIPLGFSFGGRAELMATVKDCLWENKETGEWTLYRDVDSKLREDPKVRGLVLINSFMSLGRVANAWMHIQKRTTWVLLEKYLGVFKKVIRKNIYDQMMREEDLTMGVHQRVKMASKHPQWPEIVMIATTLEGIPDIEPIPWEAYRRWRAETETSLERFAAMGKAAKDFMHRLRKKLHAMFFRRDEAPFYNWLESIFVDVTQDDSVVDLDLALGKDYHGQPLDRKIMAIKVRGIPHDCMEFPIIQQLDSQLRFLKARGVSLRKQVQLVVVSADGRSQILRLKDHNPKSPIILNRDDRISLRVVRPGKALDIQPEIPVPLSENVDQALVMDIAA